MKTSITVLIFSFITCVSSLFAQNLPVTEGLVGYWPLNGDASDFSGNNINGIITGPTETLDRNGFLNSACQFDGDDDFIIFPDDDVLNVSFENGLTISIWIKLNSIPAEDGTSISVVSKGGVFGALPKSPFSLAFNPANNKLYFDLWNTDDEVDVRSILMAAKTDWQIGEWYHIVGVWDGTMDVNSQKIYINGVLDIQRAALLDRVSIVQENLRLGNYSHTAINGAMDELLIFDRGLSETEVLELYAFSNTSTQNWKSSPTGMFYDEGNVGIGILEAQTKLAVNGTITSKEVQVTTDPAAWPDFVFDPDYKLRELSNLENYIKQHHSLPEIPDAKTIGSEGQKVGEMNVLLLKKIEELTLYILEQHKKIEKLENQMQALKAE